MAARRIPKKDDIEQAAMELFARRGFAGTTIKEIAAQAGVTEGALYRHYSSKEEMASSLFERELGLIQERLAESLSVSGSAGHKLRQVISYLYSSYEREPWPLLFVILNFQNLQGDSRLDDKKHIYDYIIEYVRELLSDSETGPQPASFVSQSSEGVEIDYEFLATLIAGLVIQPIIFHYYEKLKRHPVQYVDEITLSCCRLTGLEI